MASFCEHIILCRSKSYLRRHFLSHSEQLNGISPLCILQCRFKSSLSQNLLLHSEQANNFSPPSDLKILPSFRLYNCSHTIMNRQMPKQMMLAWEHSVAFTTNIWFLTSEGIFDACPMFKFGFGCNFLFSTFDTSELLLIGMKFLMIYHLFLSRKLWSHFEHVNGFMWETMRF